MHRAIAQVEEAGGTIETVYYSRLNLRALLKPEKFDARLLPRPALPPPKEMLQYMREDKRGYLRNLQPGDVVRPHRAPGARGHEPHAGHDARARLQPPHQVAAPTQEGGLRRRRGRAAGGGHRGRAEGVSPRAVGNATARI